MSLRDNARTRDALLVALQDELKATLAAYPSTAAARPALPFREYSDLVHEAHDVLELRSAFALARLRAPAAPPTPAAVRAALLERRERAHLALAEQTSGADASAPAVDAAPRTSDNRPDADGAASPARSLALSRGAALPTPSTRALDPLPWRSSVAPLPPTPRFDEAAAWLAAHPEAAHDVDAELAELTREWQPQLDADRERLRPIACLLVFNRSARRLAHSA